MVNVHFAFIALLALAAFSLGRTFGKVESSILFSQRVNLIISALRKVETLASLKGENIEKLSTEELVHRTQKHLNELEDKDV